MKAEIQLQPIRVPNYILSLPKVGKREDGFKEPPKFHPSELSAETLSELCDQFRHDLFAKAEMVDPKK